MEWTTPAMWVDLWRQNRRVVTLYGLAGAFEQKPTVLTVKKTLVSLPLGCACQHHTSGAGHRVKKLGIGIYVNIAW